MTAKDSVVWTEKQLVDLLVDVMEKMKAVARDSCSAD